MDYELYSSLVQLGVQHRAGDSSYQLSHRLLLTPRDAAVHLSILDANPASDIPGWAAERQKE